MGSMGHLNEFPLNGAEAGVETALEQAWQARASGIATSLMYYCTSFTSTCDNDCFKKFKNTVKRYSI
jgi:hypothetical protein